MEKKKKSTPAGCGKGLLKKRKDRSNELGAMFDNETEDKRYRRYKHRCYCYLVVEALLSFVVGVIVAFFFL